MSKIETKAGIEVEFLPEWARGRGLDEVKFCKDFLILYPLVYVDGEFFSSEGRVPERKVRGMVLEYLGAFLSGSLSRLLPGVMEVLKLQCAQDALKQAETILHCENGTLNLMEDRFNPEKNICRCRLAVKYNRNAPKPEQWLAFLEELLEPEDIPTLQEFLGYCLVPANYAQKMLLILGSGGEGKSRIGIVMQEILGSSMVNGSLAKLERSPFARADLQNRLLMVDDDLQLEALRTTNSIKSIITAEQPLDLEKKGVQSYQGLMFCRLMAFGNGNLRSLHDRSHGFFRRQIILTTKERREDRVDDPYLAQQLKQEKEGIFLWMLDGLLRLVGNDMQFTISDRARKNLQAAISEGNNVPDFLHSSGYIQLGSGGEITSRSLYHIYKDWCDDNILNPLSPRSFTMAVNQQAKNLSVEYCNYIDGGNGRRVRGFRGIRKAQGW